ncbi:hypothetical protein ARMGADRAFT_1032501 [Armillaria gallica]|uniref:Uncharacterized protein n=1 Tax=Armillaria gallica TaxID=47427 RepID=A0A2H3D9M9_ARMGA|nr:hypothetical protein ARMGADRAFT_1032501 [Armillaria gallica]
MTARMHPTPDLTDSQIKDLFVALDTQFNNTMLTASLYGNQCFEGIYTGVVAVTLWAVASKNNCENHRWPHFLVVIILLLYFLAAFNLYHVRVLCSAIFTTPAWISFWESSEFIRVPTPVILTGDIWRCWIVRGRSWCIVFIPIACTTLAIVSRGIVAYYGVVGPLVPSQAISVENIVSWSVLYSSLVLATLLWCTILIIYRIWRVGASAGRIHVYQRVIETLVESASLYSAVIAVLMVFEARNEADTLYAQGFAIAMRGIMPTMLVGRVAGGHARPNDSWSESTTRSSLRFRTRSSSQNDTQMSVVSGWETSSRVGPDLEEGLEDSTELRVELRQLPVHMIVPHASSGHRIP